MVRKITYDFSKSSKLRILTSVPKKLHRNSLYLISVFAVHRSFPTAGNHCGNGESDGNRYLFSVQGARFFPFLYRLHWTGESETKLAKRAKKNALVALTTWNVMRLRGNSGFWALSPASLSTILVKVVVWCEQVCFWCERLWERQCVQHLYSIFTKFAQWFFSCSSKVSYGKYETDFAGFM